MGAADPAHEIAAAERRQEFEPGGRRTIDEPHGLEVEAAIDEMGREHALSEPLPDTEQGDEYEAGSDSRIGQGCPETRPMGRFSPALPMAGATVRKGSERMTRSAAIVPAAAVQPARKP